MKKQVRGAGLDRAPADGLAVEIGNEAAGRVRLRMAGADLLAQPVGAHLVACSRVPKTVCRSSQLASLAGTTEITGSVAVIRRILQVEWVAVRRVARL
ncbi:MAG: hypothetical protein H0X18_15770 [Geodermatophilaceae bacterium]|nr:hypothetical protein [Geodermatophilaceae bacterium]